MEELDEAKESAFYEMAHWSSADVRKFCLSVRKYVQPVAAAAKYDVVLSYFICVIVKD